MRAAGRMPSDMTVYDKLTAVWTGICVVLFIYVLLTWFGAAGAATKSCVGTEVVTDHHEAFVMVWHTLVAGLVCVGGTFMMIKHRTAIGIGVFGKLDAVGGFGGRPQYDNWRSHFSCRPLFLSLVGAIFLMINYTLSVLVIIGGQINKKNAMQEHCEIALGTTADVLALLMGVFLFLLYILFLFLLVKSKDLLLSGGSLGGESDAFNTSRGFSSLDHNQEEALTSV
jgi:hypothetical protein